MSEAPAILYLHGFASSGASGTVQVLRHTYWEKAAPHARLRVLAPDLPVDPLLALERIRQCVARENPRLIIGTSLGAVYAQHLRGMERICINPVFNLSKLYSILSVGRHKWLNARTDGETSFQITKEIIAHFVEMEAHQFDTCDEVDSLFCHGLFGLADELSEASRALFKLHYPETYHTFDGPHSLNAELVHHVLIPHINALLKISA